MEVSVNGETFIAGFLLGWITMALMMAATAYLFGCHAALGDLCLVQP